MKIAFNPSTVAALITPPNNKDITFDLRGRNIFARGVKFCGTDTWRDIKINNVSIGSNILDLRNGSNTTLTNTNGVVTINSTWRPVVDNLTSDSTTSSLSANLGRVLKALIDGKSNSGHTHDDRYLKLTGGTMQLGEGLKFHADNNYFGTNTDARIISLLDNNDKVCDGGLIIDERATLNGKEYVTELLRIRDSEFKWKSSNILHSGNSNINGNTITINGSSLTVSKSDHTHSNYVTDLGTNGNYLTWVKNGSTNNIIVPYATTSPYLTNGFSATYTNKWDCNAPDRVVYSDYGSQGKLITNAPSGWNYGTLLELGHTNYRGINGNLNILLMWDVAHSTTLPGTLWFRGKDAINGWAKSWAKVITDLNISSILSNYYTKSETDGKYVTLTTTLTIGGSKTFTTGIQFNTNKNGDANLGSNDGFKLFYNETSGRNFPGNYYNVASFITGYTGFLLACYGGADLALKYRHREDNGTWHPWKTLAFTTDIPNSLKNPHALTISLNGASQGPYDGSAAKNINITPSSIDAATSDHNHDGRYVRYYAVTTLDCNNLMPGLTAVGVPATNAAHANHSAFLYISDVGTPFQIQIPDSNMPYIYKRYYSSDKWSGWFKLNAGYADSAGSVAWDNVTGKPSSYTPSAHTHSWTSITDKLVGGNEFNIVNAGFNNIMWFNYLPINDRSKTATISTYRFGNGAKGYASVWASGFVKTGSSSSYVLLGDGGHQTISSLSVNYANSAGNADTATALTTNAGNSINPVYFSGGKPIACTMSTGNVAGIVRSFGHKEYRSANQYFGNGTIVVIDPRGTGCISSNDTILSLGEYSDRNTQLLVAWDRDGVYYRRIEDSQNYGNWKRLAFTTDNVASATKLQTPRTIWGQSFDGTADITGIMTINPPTITDGEDNTIMFKVYSSTGYKNGLAISSTDNVTRLYAKPFGNGTKNALEIHTYNNTDVNAVTINATGNVGINTNAPAYKLDVIGNIRATGNIYATHFYESSDKTLKKNIKSILSSTNIPKIREFDWKDTGEHSYGFIALELEELGYGCLVNEADGKKTVNYTATLALTVAKLLNLINIQNKKISNLTKELKALKYGRKKNS